MKPSDVPLAAICADIERSCSLSIRNVEHISLTARSAVYLAETPNERMVLKLSANSSPTLTSAQEFQALQAVRIQGQVRAPVAVAHGKHLGVSWLLQEFLGGESLSSFFISETQCADDHLEDIFQAGQLLAKLHADAKTGHSAQRSLDHALEVAAYNLENSLYDPDEFLGIAPPGEIYEYLRTQRPDSLRECLLHGDFRPKNILVQKNGQLALIDWEHSFPGDPYYDLAVFAYYCSQDSVLTRFLDGYRLTAIDRERLRYFDLLSKLLNV
ncbi:MAG: aminoglycoside phosphotransferase family protein [Candidatus Hydrogenedentes bacterium]|nr:aminoglycoside phosphotransferase family protein [Candidatus Hydrogenedentota bacterium]